MGGPGQRPTKNIVVCVVVEYKKAIVLVPECEQSIPITNRHWCYGTRANKGDRTVTGKNLQTHADVCQIWRAKC